MGFWQEVKRERPESTWIDSVCHVAWWKVRRRLRWLMYLIALRLFWPCKNKAKWEKSRAGSGFSDHLLRDVGMTKMQVELGANRTSGI